MQFYFFIRETKYIRMTSIFILFRFLQQHFFPLRFFFFVLFANFVAEIKKKIVYFCCWTNFLCIFKNIKYCAKMRRKGNTKKITSESFEIEKLLRLCRGKLVRWKEARFFLHVHYAVNIVFRKQFSFLSVNA